MSHDDPRPTLNSVIGRLTLLHRTLCEAPHLADYHKVVNCLEEERDELHKLVSRYAGYLRRDSHESRITKTSLPTAPDGLPIP